MKLKTNNKNIIITYLAQIAYEIRSQKSEVGKIIINTRNTTYIIID